MNILRYALKNILRNPFLSISSVLIITLLAFFVNILFFILFSSDEFISKINSRISITVNVRDGFDSAHPRIGGMLKELRWAFTGISLTYISREDAFNILKERDPDLANLVENVRENPLPNSLRITNIDLASYSTLNNYIARYQDILQYDATDMNQKLLDYKAQYSRITLIVSLLETLKFTVYMLLSLFFFTVAIIIYMIIQNFIYFLKEEVEIIELVGGSPSFIYGPFVAQGIIYAGISALIAGSLIFLFLQILSDAGTPWVILTLVESFYIFFGSIFWYIFLLFSFVWGISAWIASKKHIHSTIGR